ncbi:17563_t:CDS:2, partial [Gigaspora margarita]
MHFIIIRDFNTILNEELDRSNPKESKSFKPDPLHTWLQKQSFTNTYYTLSPLERSAYAEIIDMSMTTESDHDIITTYLNLSHLTTNSGIAIIKKKTVKRTVFLYEEQIMHRNEQDHLDEIWGIIEKVIIEAANKSLLKKKISRWMRFIRDRLGLSIEETNKLEFNLTIEKINTNLQLKIQQAEDIWMENIL